MTEAIIAIISGILGALLFYVIERKTAPKPPQQPKPQPSKPPLEVDHVQTLEEITNEETPPPVNTDHLSDADWWRRHSAGDGDDR